MYNNAIPQHHFTYSNQYINAAKPFCGQCKFARYQIGTEEPTYCCIDFTTQQTAMVKIRFHFTTFVQRVAIYTYDNNIANNMTVEYSHVDLENEYRFLSSSTGDHLEVMNYSRNLMWERLKAIQIVYKKNSNWRDFGVVFSATFRVEIFAEFNFYL